jgi:gliding motility-associated-like protein
MGDGSTLEQAGIIEYLYLSPGLYRIRQVVSSTENCMDSSEKTVLIKDFVPASYVTNDRTQCFKGHALTLSDTAAPGQYIVRFGDGSQTGTLPARHQYSRPGQYALQLIKTWNSGCADTQHLKVVIHRNPTAGFQVPLLCTGKAALLKNTSTAGDTVFNSTWQTSDSGNYITRDLSRYFTHAGTWQVALQLSDANGCRDSASQTVLIQPSPEPVMFIEGSSYDQVQGYRYSFFARPDTFVQYSWSLGSAGTSDMANPRGWFGRAGNAEKISLTVKNKSGCAATTDTTLVVKGLTKYLFPSAFTPNGDNKNEGFGIAGPEYVKTYKLWIFNRWGEQVFYTEDPNELWQPSKMQTGMYVYKAKVQDLYSRWEEVNGTVTLLR